jgi:hypothetical protein
MKLSLVSELENAGVDGPPRARSIFLGMVAMLAISGYGSAPNVSGHDDDRAMAIPQAEMGTNSWSSLGTVSGYLSWMDRVSADLNREYGRLSTSIEKACFGLP